MTRKINKNISLLLFIAAITFIFSVTSCTGKNKESLEPEVSHNYENNYFVLDFEKQEYDFEDLQKYFFTTFPHKDPTLGDVVYDRTKWVNENMIEIKKNDGLYSYVRSRNDSLGFDSFRLTSKAYFNIKNDNSKILFVFKGEVPSSKGIWPAWWLNGSSEDEWLYRNNDATDEALDSFSGIGNYYDTPSAVNCTDWPSGGEIDIIETVNGDNVIHNTIHTCPQMCNSEWNDDGVIINCANSNESDPNPGCSGKTYNVDETRGTFACVLEKKSIRYYYWEPGEDIRNVGGPLHSNPDEKLWRDKYLKNEAKLVENEVDCSDEVHQAWQCENCSGSNTCTFKNMKMIFNITICGVWAGNNFDDSDSAFDNCKEYIMGEGKNLINGQFVKLEYVSVSELK